MKTMALARARLISLTAERRKEMAMAMLHWFDSLNKAPDGIQLISAIGWGVLGLFYAGLILYSRLTEKK